MRACQVRYRCSTHLGCTMSSHRLVDRILGFHPGEMGSVPIVMTKWLFSEMDITLVFGTRIEGSSPSGATKYSSNEDVRGCSKPESYGSIPYGATKMG